MKVTWPAVTLVAVIVAAFVVLSAFGRDTSTIITLGIAVLSSAGLVTGLHVKEQTNGRITQLVDLIEKQGNMLAAAPPPDPSTVNDLGQAATSNLGQTAEEEHA